MKEYRDGKLKSEENFKLIEYKMNEMYNRKASTV